jgi:hypothetical protein
MPVVYKEKFPVFGGVSVGEEKGNMFVAQIHTKAEDWKYEKEWRICLPAANAVANYERESLKAIYFGARCKETDIQLVRELAKELEWDFKMFKGRLSEESFKIVFSELRASLED